MWNVFEGERKANLDLCAPQVPLMTVEMTSKCLKLTLKGIFEL